MSKLAKAILAASAISCTKTEVRPLTEEEYKDLGESITC